MMNFSRNRCGSPSKGQRGGQKGMGQWIAGREMRKRRRRRKRRDDRRRSSKVEEVHIFGVCRSVWVYTVRPWRRSDIGSLRKAKVFE